MPQEFELNARDGYRLAATRFDAESPKGAVLMCGATGVPRRFYHRFAAALAAGGYTTVLFDYRGIGGSKPKSLRGFDADMTDWALKDLAGAVDWMKANIPHPLFLTGHSFGGQVAGLLDNVDDLAGMFTVSSQSGYYMLQGAEQKAAVFFHVHVTLPLLAKTVGYVPWKSMGIGEDLPKGVALQWAKWCRHPRYLRRESALPLHRYKDFRAPVLATSIGDDKWGTAKSVDDMMSSYPNMTREHIEPEQAGVGSLGHMGYFRKTSASLWKRPVEWMDSVVG